MHGQENRACMVAEHRARLRRMESKAIASEEARSELLLEVGEPVTGRRQGDVAGIRRSREAAQFHTENGQTDRQEVKSSEVQVVTMIAKLNGNFSLDVAYCKQQLRSQRRIRAVQHVCARDFGRGGPLSEHTLASDG
jgi:hypothetical protein